MLSPRPCRDDGLWLSWAAARAPGRLRGPFFAVVFAAMVLLFISSEQKGSGVVRQVAVESIGSIGSIACIAPLSRVFDNDSTGIRSEDIDLNSDALPGDPQSR